MYLVFEKEEGEEKKKTEVRYKSFVPVSHVTMPSAIFNNKVYLYCASGYKRYPNTPVNTYVHLH